MITDTHRETPRRPGETHAPSGQELGLACEVFMEGDQDVPREQLDQVPAWSGRVTIHVEDPRQWRSASPEHLGSWDVH